VEVEELPYVVDNDDWSFLDIPDDDIDNDEQT
jgi:hypothetical protein